MQAKNTPLTSIHESLGARMAVFAGYNMPIEYTGINDEHLCVCRKLGVFDVSHMGEFWVLGRQALPFIQHITCNDAAALADGKVQYSCLMHEGGGVVDDLLVYRFSAEKYLLVVNASNIDKDFAEASRHAARFGLTVGVDLINASEDFALLAVQGPLALAAMQPLCAAPLGSMPYYTFKELRFAGIEGVMLSTTGYTGAGGCELYVRSADAPALWEAVMEAGRALGVQPIGLGARDTLRLEMGFCLYGHELSDHTTPLEAGLGWITKLSKDFVGRDALLRQKEAGLSRQLVGFALQDRGVARAGYEIYDSRQRRVGEVTSGTVSPLTKASIGMGYVEAALAPVGTPIFIKVRDKLLAAEVAKPPFRPRSA